MSALAPSLVRLIDTKNDIYAEIQDTLTKVSEHLYNTVLLSGKIIEEIGAFSASNHNVKGTSGFDDIFQTDANPYVFKFAAKLSEVRLHVERLQIIRNHQVLTFTTIGKDLAAHKEAFFVEQRRLSKKLEELLTLLKSLPSQSTTTIEMEDNDEEYSADANQEVLLSTLRKPEWNDQEYLLHLQRAKAQRTREIRNQNKVMNELVLRCSALYNDLSNTLEAGVGGLDL